MDIEEFLKDSQRKLNEIHKDTLEIKQLLKYAFNKDILEEPKESDSPPLTPIPNFKKDFVTNNKFTAGLSKKLKK
ncbi:unnamed protein product [Blepharisma stoltei]|uniref:Uncharacterized protein n=1 Tax=Blepharisma stoltei TaxID=1481888 RepID=A0AAU9JYC0_9CILI|nr:unnamed protein product [Blepharisma stoltei]